MKEKPILFSGPMVNAIIEGRKTVTRRIIKPQPELSATKGMIWKGGAYGITADGDERGALRNFEKCAELNRFHNHKRPDRPHAFSPYGLGDHLWVRETWGTGCRPDPFSGWVDGLEYRADEAYLEDGDVLPLYSVDTPENVSLADYPSGWRPSIHMPRWASRIMLEVTDIKVERLQNITEECAKAEGMFFTDYGRDCFHPLIGGTGHVKRYDQNKCSQPVETHPQRAGWMWRKTDHHHDCLHTARMAFANLWNDLGGEGAWAADPFVWVIHFRRIDAEAKDIAA